MSAVPPDSGLYRSASSGCVHLRLPARIPLFLDFGLCDCWLCESSPRKPSFPALATLIGICIQCLAVPPPAVRTFEPLKWSAHRQDRYAVTRPTLKFRPTGRSAPRSLERFVFHVKHNQASWQEMPLSNDEGAIRCFARDARRPQAPGPKRPNVGIQERRPGVTCRNWRPSTPLSCHRPPAKSRGTGRCHPPVASRGVGLNCALGAAGMSSLREDRAGR